jgi:hypothetical protein
MTKSKSKPDDPAQYKRFLEAAREAEAETSKEAADKAFQSVAKPAISQATKDRASKNK